MSASKAANYPNGFTNGVTIRGIPITQSHTGQVFWVSNSTALLTGQIGGSDGNKGSFDQPFSTLDYAIGKCTASRGDIIFVKPGHAETISSATALLADVAGVAIIGCGLGSMRPTFTFDTATTATIPVSAANVTFKNCIFTANFADIVAPFTLTTAKYFTLEDCLIKATATNMNFLNIVDTDATTNNADGLALLGNKWIEPDLATLGMVKMDGTNDDVRIEDNYTRVGVNNNVATLMAIATGKVVTTLSCMRNLVYRLNTDTATGGLLITTDGSTNSGIIGNNYAQHADTAAEILVTASSGFGFFENRASGVAGATGYVLPAVDS
jgi:hypothetical protein